MRDVDWFVGFVNVVWDGGVHVFVLDTMVAADARRRGVGRALVGIVVREVCVVGCEWLHVDFDLYFCSFYFAVCGFTSTDVGVIRLG